RWPYNRSRGENRLSDHDVFRPGHFDVFPAPFHYHDRMPKPFDEIRIVRCMDSFSMCLPVSLLQPLPSECLWGLRQPQRMAVNGSLNDLVRANLFDSVTHRKSDNCGSMFVGF